MGRGWMEFVRVIPLVYGYSVGSRPVENVCR
jgi:hypothetical protein